jgi:hypothetical protein
MDPPPPYEAATGADNRPPPAYIGAPRHRATPRITTIPAYPQPTPVPPPSSSVNRAAGPQVSRGISTNRLSPNTATPGTKHLLLSALVYFLSPVGILYLLLIGLNVLENTVQ